MSDIDEFKRFALLLVDATAPLLKNHFKSRAAVYAKGDGTPVTAADRECEMTMREMIIGCYPTHGILGEEMGSVNPDAEYVWVLDPIDGTKSFISGGFDFGTLIGLLKNGQPVLGVIAHPILGDVVVGDNASCTFNSEQVRVIDDCRLSDALCLLTDIALPSRFQSAKGFDELRRRVGAIRTWGNCFGYTLLVRGLAHAMIDPVMSPWDLLPLIPIVRGAGGVITDYQGNDAVGGTSIIAASPAIHGELVEILNGARDS